MPDRTGTAASAAARSGRLPGPARTVLAVLLLAMAAGQLSDPAGFARVLAGYRLLPDWLLSPAAWAMVGAGAVAGVGLLGHRRWGSFLGVAVALVWSALTIQAFARGIALDNCGCFGVHLGQPLRWWVLLEDAGFVALAAWVRRGEDERRRAETVLSPPAAASGRSPRQR